MSDTLNHFKTKLDEGGYASITGARRAISKFKNLPEADVNKAYLLANRHFGEESAAAASPTKKVAKKAAGKKVSKKAAVKKVVKKTEPTKASYGPGKGRMPKKAASKKAASKKAPATTAAPKAVPAKAPPRKASASASGARDKIALAHEVMTVTQGNTELLERLNKFGAKKEDVDPLLKLATEGVRFAQEAANAAIQEECGIAEVGSMQPAAAVASPAPVAPQNGGAPPGLPGLNLPGVQV